MSTIDNSQALPEAPQASVETPTPTIGGLEALLGYQFKKRELLEQALTHKSFANEQGASSGSRLIGDNERLEYLGDAVLDLAMSDMLIHLFPQDPEGALSKKRASLVNEDTLSRIAIGLKLDAMIRLGRGEIKTGGLQKPRILASCLEAVFGAIFLDTDYVSARTVADRLFAEWLNEIAKSGVDFRSDFKTRLQEAVQEKFRLTPVYQVEAESGPDHEKVFQISVRVDGKILATGQGKSKKAAEQDAARQALELMI